MVNSSPPSAAFHRSDSVSWYWKCYNCFPNWTIEMEKDDRKSPWQQNKFGGLRSLGLNFCWTEIYNHSVHHKSTELRRTSTRNCGSAFNNAPMTRLGILLPHLKEKAQRLGSVVCLLSRAEVVRSPANWKDMAPVPKEFQRTGNNVIEIHGHWWILLAWIVKHC